MDIVFDCIGSNWKFNDAIGIELATLFLFHPPFFFPSSRWLPTYHILGDLQARKIYIQLPLNCQYFFILMHFSFKLSIHVSFCLIYVLLYIFYELGLIFGIFFG